eukprot:1179330-Prorocentrum_minimum.AAC.4
MATTGHKGGWIESLQKLQHCEVTELLLGFHAVRTINFFPLTCTSQRRMPCTLHIISSDDV